MEMAPTFNEATFDIMNDSREPMYPGSRVQDWCPEDARWQHQSPSKKRAAVGQLEIDSFVTQIEKQNWSIVSTTFAQPLWARPVQDTYSPAEVVPLGSKQHQNIYEPSTGEVETEVSGSLVKMSIVRRRRIGSDPTRTASINRRKVKDNPKGFLCPIETCGATITSKPNFNGKLFC